jgi:hypothetical protein
MVRGRFITREEVGLGSIEGSSFQNRQDGSLQLGTLQDYVERYGYEPKNPFKSPPATEIVRVDDPECESHHDKTVRLYCDMMDLPLSGKIGAERRPDSYDDETTRFFHGCVEKESGIFDSTMPGLVREILALSSPEPGQVEALSSILTFLYAGNESKGTEEPWDQKDADMMSLVGHTPVKLLRLGKLYFLSLNGKRVSRIRLTSQGAASEIVRLTHIDGYEDAGLEAVKDYILETIGAPWKTWL